MHFKRASVTYSRAGGGEAAKPGSFQEGCLDPKLLYQSASQQEPDGVLRGAD